MVVDSSAVMAIVLDEPEATRFLDLLLGPPRPVMSAATLVELAAIATLRFGGRLDHRIDHLLESVTPEIVAVTPRQAEIARDAYRRYGLGSGHRAALNFSDCFAYALAKDTGAPLLFKGDDFVHTDVEAAA